MAVNDPPLINNNNNNKFLPFPPISACLSRDLLLIFMFSCFIYIYIKKKERGGNEGKRCAWGCETKKVVCCPLNASYCFSFASSLSPLPLHLTTPSPHFPLYVTSHSLSLSYFHLSPKEKKKKRNFKSYIISSTSFLYFAKLPLT